MTECCKEQNVSVTDHQAVAARGAIYFVLSRSKDSMARVHSSTLVILAVCVGDRILFVAGSLLGV